MDVDSLVSEVTARIAAADDTAALEEIRIEVLGRKAALVQALRELASLPPEERRARGDELNRARRSLESLVEGRARELRGKELEERLRTDRVDITLPGVRHPRGYSHLIEQTRRDILDVFVGFGYVVVDGPEIDLVHYNFDALNHDITHPARDHTDTFYVAPDIVLRTHTSPMQVRAMEAHPPPLYVVIPGRTYRRDSDATHTPQFHQVEGLAVDEDITLADLKGTLLSFANAIFGAGRDVRLRPHFFPFTEPSVEVDVSCFNCTDGVTADGERCPLCKGTAWIEILGAGMVDPNVFDHVREYGYDPEEVQGFAFGMGIERIAMLKHGVPDLRLLYDNDVRFVEQFG